MKSVWECTVWKWWQNKFNNDQDQHALQLSVNYIFVCTKSIYIIIQSVFKEYSLDLIGARPIFYNRTLEISILVSRVMELLGVKNVPWQQVLHNTLYTCFTAAHLFVLLCSLSLLCLYVYRPVHFLSPSHQIVYTLAAGALAGTFTNLFLMSEKSWIRMDDPYLTAFLNCE